MRIMLSSTIKVTARIVLFAVCSVAFVDAQDKPTVLRRPLLIAKPDAFQTLVNPECSHCRDEAKRRATELREDDRVLSWIRGYSDGGAIPYRFFLNPYRVISDSYGVFVYDSDAGFARGFAPSYDFSFHGWRNGVMVMKHKDGTLYSCLTGVAFDGPRKGDRLEPVPTLVTNWGSYLTGYPGGVAYKMFEKYQPIELRRRTNEDSLRSRGRNDQRLADETPILGVVEGTTARAYPQEILAKSGMISEEIDGRSRVILWYAPTRTAAAYRPLASPPKKGTETPRTVNLEMNNALSAAPFVDKETGSRWDIAGRAVEGELQGWTLNWLEGVQVRWFAWAAEYADSSIYGEGLSESDFKPMSPDSLDVARPHGNLDVGVRHFAILKAVDVSRQTVSLLVDGETEPGEWPLSRGAEVLYSGWWGRLDQFRVGDRVWIWFETDRAKRPLAISLLADELSEQDLYAPLKVKVVGDSGTDQANVVLEIAKGGQSALRTVNVANAEVHRENRKGTHDGLKVGEIFHVQTTGEVARLILDPATFETQRIEQKAILRKRWMDEGLPGTVVFDHTERHELELMLDHEGMRWSRSLKPGDKVTLQTSHSIQPMPAEVRGLRPWRERTQVLVMVDGLDGSPLTAGQRVSLRMAAPPVAVKDGNDDRYPTGLGPSRGKPERIEWLVSNVYCSCMMHDECAGHLFTLAACDAAGKTPCGLAKRTREVISERIEQGYSDRQIFDELLKDRGTKLLRPHLSP